MILRKSINLAASPAFVDKMEHLQRTIRYWSEATGDTIPGNPMPDRKEVYGKKYPGFTKRRDTRCRQEGNQIGCKRPAENHRKPKVIGVATLKSEAN